MKKNLSGFGVGFRPPHYREITETPPPSLDWLEIITENFINEAPRPKMFLEKLRRDFPLAIHGVSLSICSREELDPEYLKKLKNLVSWIQPEIVSDHLCWTSFEGHNSHDLLPTPFTKINLAHVATKVEQVQNFLRRQLVLENPSAYVAFSCNEMSESDFFAELCNKTGCGILLDINNAFVNWKNLGQDPLKYFSGLPKKSIKQFHLAGHSEQKKILIDTHDHPVPEGVWDLYRFAATLWPDVPTLVEWDENIPPLNVLLSEVDKAKDARKIIGIPLSKSKEQNIKVNSESLDLIYKSFFSSVTDLEGTDNKAVEFLNINLPVSAEDGLHVYGNAYFLRLEAVLKDLFPTLAWIMEEDGFRNTMAAYLNVFRPGDYSIDKCGENLAAFLNENDLDTDFGVSRDTLSDIARVEWAKVEVFGEVLSEENLTGIRILDLNWDVVPVCEATEKGQDPEKPLQEKCQVIVWNTGSEILFRKLSKEENETLNIRTVGSCPELPNTAQVFSEL